MTTNQPDWAEKRAAELLPCWGVSGMYCSHEGFDRDCPAKYRPVVAQALREARCGYDYNKHRLLDDESHFCYWRDKIAPALEQEAVAAERRGYERVLEYCKIQIDGIQRSSPTEATDGALRTFYNVQFFVERALTAKEP